MSVDQRLRDAFAHESVSATSLPSLTTVRQAARRRRTARLGALGAAAAVAAGVVAVAVAAGPDPAPTPLGPPAPTTSDGPVVVTPLEGTWQTPPLPASQVRATLQAAGLGRHAATIVDALPDDRIVIRLVVERRKWDLTVRRADGGYRVFDHEWAFVEGERLTIVPRNDGTMGSSSYTWRVSGGELRLTFVDTDELPSGEVPAEAWQRALYTTSSFVRQ